MTPDEQLLTAIHKTSEMGKNTLNKLKEKCEDNSFLAVIDRQYEEYKRFFMSADTLLKACEGDDSGVPAGSKVMGDMMIDMASLRDKSTCHYADMVLKGTERGITELDDAMIKLSSAAKPETLNLAEALRSVLICNKSELLRIING
ncbi:MAG: hypothetical protein RSA97_04075 [Oscillospiraceae bacterium]